MTQAEVATRPVTTAQKHAEKLRVLCVWLGQSGLVYDSVPVGVYQSYNKRMHIEAVAYKLTPWSDWELMHLKFERDTSAKAMRKGVKAMLAIKHSI